MGWQIECDYHRGDEGPCGAAYELEAGACLEDKRRAERAGWDATFPGPSLCPKHIGQPAKDPRYGP